MAPRSRTPLRRLLAVSVALPCVALTMTALPSTAVAAAGPTLASTRYRDADAQAAVDTSRTAYETARERVAALSAQSAQLEDNAALAAAEAERLHAAVSDEQGGFLQGVGDLLRSGDSDLDRAVDAAGNAADARRLADMVQGVLADSIQATETARLTWEKAERRQAEAASAFTADEAARAAIRHAQLQPSYAVTEAGQDRRNHRALDDWHAYLRGLADNSVVPPQLHDLDDPARIDAPLEPLRDARNQPSPGLAVVDRPRHPAVTVISTEAVRAVSEAFRRVGLSEVPGAIDPTAYACGGLVANAWGSSPSTSDLPGDVLGQWTDLASVPVRAMQLGDVVVLGSRADGLGGAGIYVGRDRVVVADPTTGVAAVRPLDRRPLGVRRVGVPASGRHPDPPTGGVCAPTVDSSTGTGTGAGPLTLPVPSGSYHLTAGFGSPGPLWSTGTHTGLDFAAPVGTPVVAAAPGTVTVEHPDWAGNLVRIDHGGGVETWYAHLSRVDVSTGQTLAAGDAVGLVGDLGNTSGPHLHLEVRLDGVAYDPAQVLDLPELPRPTYPNGEVPDDALCPATPDGSQLLRCDAAVAFRLVGAAYAQDLGTDLCLTDSYRSRTGQESVFAAKPGLAATPGTSVHGLGLAIDTCGGIERFGSAEHDWLVEHGPAYGWVHPGWAAEGGSRPEPWHFEYVGGDG